MSETKPINKISLVFNPIVAVCIILCIAGIGYFIFWDMVNWNRYLIEIILGASIGGLAISLIGYFTRIKPTVLYALVFTVVCFALNLMAAATAVLVFWGIAYSLGDIFFRFSKVGSDSNRPSGITRVICGYVILMLMLTVLAYTSFNTIPVYLLLFGTPCLFVLSSSFRKTDNLNLQQVLITRQSRDDWFQIFILSVVLVLLFICALQPDIGSDSINAYRSKLLELREFGRFTYDPEKTVIGLIPNSGVWAQAFVVIISDSYEAAKLINFSKLVVSVFVIQALLSHLRLDTNTRGKYAAYGISAAVLSMPIFVYTSLQGFYDNSVYFISMVFIYLVVLTKQNQNWFHSSVIVGLTSGLMILTKLTSVFVAPAFALFYLIITYRTKLGKTVYFGWIIAGFVAILIVASFMLFVFTQTGNPIFPLYNSIFNSPYYEAKDLKGPHHGYFSWKLFWDMTFNTASFSQKGARNGQLGLIGILFLSCLLMLPRVGAHTGVEARKLTISALVCFALGAMLMAFFQNSARYLIVVLPFLTFALGLLVWEYKSRETAILLAIFTASNLYLLPHFGYGRIRLDYAFPSNHKQVIYDLRPARLIADRLMDDYGYSGRVLFFGSNGGYHGRVFENSWYDYATGKALRNLDCAKEESFTRFVSERNLDAVVVTTHGRRYLDRFKPECYQFLEKIAKEEIYVGSALIYTMPNFISHDIISEFKQEPIASNRPVFSEKGVTSVSIELEVSCKGSVNLRLLSKRPDGGWGRVVFLPVLCHDSIDKINIRFDELEADNTSIITFDYSKDSDILTVSGAIYSR